MSTLVCFHAHPDDESIATGGTMAKAKAEGHRVVLVVATRGERGEVADGFLDSGESLAQRRVDETHASAEVLGIDRVEFLGYEDSGMMGEPTNDHPECFWQADVDEAAERLARLLREEAADVVTVYDSHGNYGHPDHIQVHRVGVRAARLAGVERIFESTMNRDELLRQITEGAEAMAAEMGDLELPNPDDFQEMGTPEAEVTHAIDVAAWAEQKRESMRCHASQIPEDSFFLRMPAEVFRGSFGTEWFIEHGGSRASDSPFRTSLFDQ